MPRIPALVAPLLLVLQETPPEPVEASAPVPADDVAVLSVDLPQGPLPLYIPRDEELEFEVNVEITILETTVADCVMRSRVEPYRPPLLLGGGAASEDEEGKETATLQIHATGEHMLYTMDALMETRILPQEWPAAVYRSVQKGTEKRRRELLLGTRDGRASASYRADTRRGAPEGTRIWSEAESFDVEPGALDMMRAIYMIRTLVRDGHESLRFVMVNKKEQWNVHLHRGETRILETGAGRFRALEVLMDTEVEGGSGEEEFQGPFGLAGTIHLWVESTTGVPVLIAGDLPAGIFTLGVEVRLESYRGTPLAFQPL